MDIHNEPSLLNYCEEALKALMRFLSGVRDGLHKFVFVFFSEIYMVL